MARAAELFGGRGRAGAAGPAGPSLPRVPPATAKGPVGLGLSAVTTTAVAVGGAGGPGLEPTNDEASASEVRGLWFGVLSCIKLSNLDLDEHYVAFSYISYNND